VPAVALHANAAKMVLAQLGGNIAGALARMSKATVVDEKVLAECLNEISRALLQADVRFETVRDVKANIKTTANLDALAAGTDKRRIIQKVTLDRSLFLPRLIPLCCPC
jgi:signal recognition particle subunit SRP54